MPLPTKETKKSKKKKSSKKIRRLFNLVGGGGGNGSKKEEQGDASTEERVVETSAAAVKKTSDYYMSKIQALEKAIAEMRSAGKKTMMMQQTATEEEETENATVSHQEEEKSSSSVNGKMPADSPPAVVKYSSLQHQECVSFAVNHVSSSCSSLSLLSEEQSLESIKDDEGSFPTIAVQQETVLPDTLISEVATQQDTMNYFRSRFFRQDALYKSNPFNSAESILSRDYRHRRRRKDLDELIQLTNQEHNKADKNHLDRSNSFRRRLSQDDNEDMRQAKRKQSPVEVNYFQTQVVCSLEESEPLKIIENSSAIAEVSKQENQVAQVQVEVSSVEETLDLDKTTVCDDTNEDEEDPLGFIEIKSAAQWKAVSKRISWNFEDKKEEPVNLPVFPATIPNEKTLKTKSEVKEVDDKPPLHDYNNIEFDIYCPEYDGSIAEFKPTKVQQLRLICWKIKPWKQPKQEYGQPRLFTSTFAAPWGADCDEVYPGLFIGDKASASNVAFLKRYGITHVLNAAEGCEEGLVDLSDDHYQGSGITYLGFPLWDAPGCNLTPYLGIAADYINSAIDNAGGKCLVNCQMGVSRSASCALAYLMLYKGMTAVDGLTLVRKSRDCRPNDGFLNQLINLDNQLRLEREHNLPRKLRLSSLKDKYRLPLSWHTEFWIPNEVSEEELGFPLVPMGQCLLSLKLNNQASSPSLSRRSSSTRSSRSSSKRNSFRAGLCYNRRSRNSSRNVSRHSSFKRSRPTSTCLSVKSGNEDTEWEWVWETEEEEEEEEEKNNFLNIAVPTIEQKLLEVNEIIAKPEEKWRQIHRSITPRTSSRNSCSQPKITAQIGVEENDPLSMVKVASAKQWKTISRKLTINFDDLEEVKTPQQQPTSNMTSIKTPFEEALDEAKKQAMIQPEVIEQTLEDDSLDDRPDTPLSFKPTTVQELRRLCWQVKPWDQPKKTFAERQLFTSILATPWGVDADEVHPRILVGDQAAARNIAFLKRFGITHVLNAAEGPWTEHCVDLSAEHYQGSGITYQGLPLWDSTEVNIMQYLGCAADFIKSALADGQKCLVNCQMGVSRSCSAAMAYLMIHEEMSAVEILRTFRKRRDVRPNDYFMEQIVELDNDLRKERECGISRTIHLPSLTELGNLPKPWHYEFWKDIPDDLPFDLSYLKPPPMTNKQKASNRASMMSNASSEWEWEYYSHTEEEEDDEFSQFSAEE